MKKSDILREQVSLLLEQPWFSALWFISFALARTFIEFELQETISLAHYSSIAHAVSYFFLCYVVTLFILQIGRKKGIFDAFKWANISFVILPFPPIIDYLCSVRIHQYTYAPKEHLWGNLITFFSKYSDATLGQQILGIYIVIITFTAIYVSQRRILPSIAAPVVIYLFSVMASIDWIRCLLPSGSYDFFEARYMASRILHQGFTFFYVFSSLFFLCIWWIVTHWKTVYSLLESIRPIRTLHMIQMGIFGLLESTVPISAEMFGLNIFFLTLTISLSWWLIAFVNDYNDIKIDIISNSGRFHTRFQNLSNYLIGGIFWLGISSFILAFSLGIVVLLLWGLYVLGGIIYSLPPFRFRKNLIASFFIGLGSANLYLIGSTSYLSPTSNFWQGVNWKSFIIILIGFGLSGYIKDEKDRFGDKLDGIRTIFTQFEYEKARKIVCILLLFGWITISFLATNLSSICFSIFCISLSMYLYYKKKSVGWQILLFQLFFLFLNIYVFAHKSFVKNYIVW